MSLESILWHSIATRYLKSGGNVRSVKPIAKNVVRLPTNPNQSEERFVVVGSLVVRLHRSSLDHKGFWYDDAGTLWATQDTKDSADPVARCGVWPLVITGTPMDDACKVHDFMYGSAVYQYFNTRKEADAWLAYYGKLNGVPMLGWLFSKIARMFGARFWDNDATNN